MTIDFFFFSLSASAALFLFLSLSTLFVVGMERRQKIQDALRLHIPYQIDAVIHIIAEYASPLQLPSDKIKHMSPLSRGYATTFLGCMGGSILCYLAESFEYIHAWDPVLGSMTHLAHLKSDFKPRQIISSPSHGLFVLTASTIEWLTVDGKFVHYFECPFLINIPITGPDRPRLTISSDNILSVWARKVKLHEHQIDLEHKRPVNGNDVIIHHYHSTPTDQCIGIVVTMLLDGLIGVWEKWNDLTLLFDYDIAVISISKRDKGQRLGSFSSNCSLAGSHFAVRADRVCIIVYTGHKTLIFMLNPQLVTSTAITTISWPDTANSHLAYDGRPGAHLFFGSTGLSVMHNRED